MKIVCNNVPRDVIYGDELSAKERADFDFIDDESISAHAFFRYKGQAYALADFMFIDDNIAPHPQRPGWEYFDGYASDSYFSGLLVKYMGPDRVLVASYYC